MPLPDTMFCAQQIDIAQELPDILKNFTKAAVRTQPEDLLLWSAAYFTALSKGERLPVKDRLELNVTNKMDSAMTPGLLKTLHKQGDVQRGGTAGEVEGSVSTHGSAGDPAVAGQFWLRHRLDGVFCPGLQFSGRDAHKFPQGCLRAADGGRGGRSCQDPVRHFCQTLHLPGSPGGGHATGSH
uniref:Ropporin-1-like protein n=1 Tax=Gasterosteus aculeatus aculeatus TaxID=481459 RepID=G3NCT2_GASAC